MKQVSVGIILHDGHVLACQRKPDAHYPLKWEFPGGKVEDGETFEKALVRELHEELSITIEGAEKFHQQDWVYRDSVSERNATGAFRVAYFLVRSFDGEPVNNAFEQIRWVRPSDLLSMDILEGNIDAVKKLILHEERNPSKGGAEQAA